MPDPYEVTINAVLAQIKDWHAEIAPTLLQISNAKATINGLCKLSGRELMFPEGAGLEVAQTSPAAVVGTETAAIKVDQFTGMGLATAAQAFLEMRHAKAGGTSPASVDQIHEALTAGGYAFPSKDVENQKRGIAVSLAKNTYSFRRIGNGLFGLASWYGSSSPPRRRPRPAPSDNGNGQRLLPGPATEGQLQPEEDKES